MSVLKRSSDENASHVQKIRSVPSDAIHFLVHYLYSCKLKQRTNIALIIQYMDIQYLNISGVPNSLLSQYEAEGEVVDLYLSNPWHPDL